MSIYGQLISIYMLFIDFELIYTSCQLILNWFQWSMYCNFWSVDLNLLSIDLELISIYWARGVTNKGEPWLWIKKPKTNEQKSKRKLKIRKTMKNIFFSTEVQWALLQLTYAQLIQNGNLRKPLYIYIYMYKKQQLSNKKRISEGEVY